MGATISYYLKSAPSGEVKLAILDHSGAVVRDLTATKEAGINRVQWDLRGKPLVQSGRGGARARRTRWWWARRRASPLAAAGGGGGRGGPTSAMVDPGEYVARLTVNGHDFTTPVHVEADPTVTMTSQETRNAPFGNHGGDGASSQNRSCQHAGRIARHAAGRRSRRASMRRPPSRTLLLRRSRNRRK